ncbi:hypothetical protein GOB57_10250 [Sinorhizobium meliloti]|nr:hypothetical protein [Sinorhizobium meliloti]
MRVVLSNGESASLQWPHGTHGYVAESVTITEDDAKRMLEHMQRDPKGFSAAMEQLLARFPANRL